MTETTHEFKVGDTVRLVDASHCYQSPFMRNNQMEGGAVLTMRAREEHETPSRRYHEGSVSQRVYVEGLTGSFSASALELHEPPNEFVETLTETKVTKRLSVSVSKTFWTGRSRASLRVEHADEFTAPSLRLGFGGEGTQILRHEDLKEISDYLAKLSDALKEIEEANQDG